MKFTVSIILFVFMVSFYGQCQSMSSTDSIESVKKLLRKNGSIESLYVGAHLSTSKQCLRFLFILKRSSTADVTSFLNETSKCLRLYAYIYLCSINYNGMRKVRLEFEKDSSRVNYLTGCVGGNVEVRKVLKRLKYWESQYNLEMWIRYYNDNENILLGYLISDK